MSAETEQNIAVQRSPVTPDPDFKLKDLLGIVIRGRLILLSAVAFGLLTAGLWVFATPKRYSATTTIELLRINNQTNGLSDLSGRAPELGSAEEIATDLQTQEDVAGSDSVLLAAVQSSGILNEPPYALTPKERARPEYAEEIDLPIQQTLYMRNRILKMVRARLGISTVKGSRILAITYTDGNPKRAAVIANSIGDAFLDGEIQSRLTASRGMADRLRAQVHEFEREAVDAQEAASNFKKRPALVGAQVEPDGQNSNITAGTSTSLTRYVDFNQKLTEAENARIAKQAIYQKTQEMQPDILLALSNTNSDAGDDLNLAQLRTLRNRQNQLDLELTDARTRYDVNNPVITEITQQQNALKQQITEELRRINLRAKSAYEVAAKTEDLLRARVQQQRGEVSSTARDQDTLERLEQDSASKQRLYTSLQSKVDEASVAEGLRASDLRVVDRATVPVTPSSPKLLRSLLAGAAVCGLLGLVSLIFWNMVDHRIRDLDAILQMNNATVVGSIPIVKPAGGLHWLLSPIPRMVHLSADLVWEEAQYPHVSEAFRSLRAILLRCLEESQTKALLFLPAVADNSLDDVIFLFAAGFARQGRRTLLLDTSDSPARGWIGAEHLTQPAPEAVQGIPGLEFVCISGKHSDEEGLRQRIGALGPDFDLIVVRCRPLMASQAMALAPLGPLTIFLARAGVTHRSVLEQMISNVRAVSAQPTVTVLTDTELTLVESELASSGRA